MPSPNPSWFSSLLGRKILGTRRSGGESDCQECSLVGPDLDERVTSSSSRLRVGKSIIDEEDVTFTNQEVHGAKLLHRAITSVSKPV